jgi:protein-tyrosine phosphatase
MIDLHAHILPGVDDGPADMDEALALARTAVASGTRVLAATPHINRTLNLDPERLEPVRAALTDRLAAEEIPLEVVAGGEIGLDRWADLDDAALHRLALGGGRCLLLECPLFGTADMEPAVGDLQRRGFDVLLAHPERSPDLQRDPERLGALVADGAYAQLTAGSFAGDFGPVARRAAERMLDAGWVDVVASDTHDPVGRPPDLHLAGLAPEQLQRLTEAGPAAILTGARPVRTA